MMGDNDTITSPAEANAAGIMQCLKMLAEEAASLRLTRTLAALRAAMAVCAAENDCAGAEDMPWMAAPSTAIH